MPRFQNNNSESLFSRFSQSSLNKNSEISLFQQSLDQNISEFSSELTDLSTIVPMMTGSVAYSLFRSGSLTLMGSSLPSRMFSSVIGLAGEVTVFEGAGRSLRGEVPIHRDSTRSDSLVEPSFMKAWFHSFVNFGLLKLGGHAGANQNLFIQHLMQDSAMVAGNYATSALGLSDRPEGSLFEQALQAEMTNIQLGFSMSVAHRLTPGLSGYERMVGLMNQTPTINRDRLPVVEQLIAPPFSQKKRLLLPASLFAGLLHFLTPSEGEATINQRMKVSAPQARSHSNNMDSLIGLGAIGVLVTFSERLRKRRKDTELPYNILDFKNISPLKNRKTRSSNTLIMNTLISAETVMAYIESTSQPNLNLARRISEDLSLWEHPSNNSILVNSVRPMMHEAFQNFFERLQSDESFRNQNSWRTIEDEYLLYTYALSIQGKTKSVKTAYEFQERLIIRRAFTRLLKMGMTSEDVIEFINEKSSTPLRYSHLVEATGFFDPFESLSLSDKKIPEQLINMPLQWLRNQQEAKELLKHLEQIRSQTLAQGDFSQLRKVLKASGTVEERVDTLRIQVEQNRTSFKIRVKESRSVIWNPYDVEKNLVISSNDGEGVLVGRASDQADRIVIRFPGKNGLITLLEKNVAYSTDRTAYDKISQERVSRFENFSWLGAFRLWVAVNRPELEAAGLAPSLEKKYFYVLKNGSTSLEIPITRFDAALKNLLIRQDGVHLFSINLMKQIYSQAGVDPVAFAMRMLMGEAPSELLTGKVIKDHTDPTVIIDRIFTTDVIRGFIQSRPWHPQLVEGQTPEVWPVQSAGIYYPEYYRDSQRPNDLTELYFAYREGNPEAFSEVVERMRPKIERWRNSLDNPENAVVIPMIGTAPNQALAEALGHPTLFPWLPRPENYGQGVEGKRAWVKWQMVDQALQLDPTFASRITGKSVLILDDNLTDGVTYVMARKRLLEAGAQKIGLAVLTQTVRHPREFEWLPPGSID